MTGIVERRSAGLGIPFPPLLKITLGPEEHAQILYGDPLDLTSDGMKLTAPATLQVEPGQKLTLLFDLPNVGVTTVDGVITDRRQPSPSGRLHYGIQFSAMDPATWKAIATYCRGPARPDSLAQEDPTAIISVENKPTGVAASCVSVTLRVNADDPRLAQLEDISCGGVRVRLSQPLPLNTQVKLSLRYGEKTVAFDGVIVWSAREASEMYTMGIFFNALIKSQFQALNQLIQRLIA